MKHVQQPITYNNVPTPPVEPKKLFEQLAYTQTAPNPSREKNSDKNFYTATYAPEHALGRALAFALDVNSNVFGGLSFQAMLYKIITTSQTNTNSAKNATQDHLSNHFLAAMPLFCKKLHRVAQSLSSDSHACVVAITTLETTVTQPMHVASLAAYTSDRHALLSHFMTTILAEPKILIDAGEHFVRDLFTHLSHIAPHTDPQDAKKQRNELWKTIRTSAESSLLPLLDYSVETTSVSYLGHYVHSDHYLPTQHHVYKSLARWHTMLLAVKNCYALKRADWVNDLLNHVKDKMLDVRPWAGPDDARSPINKRIGLDTSALELLPMNEV